MDKSLVHISILLTHVLQKPMLLYSMWTMLVSIDVDTNIENNSEYNQVYAWYTHIVMSSGSFYPKLCNIHAGELCITVKIHSF